MNLITYQITDGNLILATAETKAGCIAQLANVALPTSIEIEKREDSQRVFVCNKIWVNKRVELPTSYNSEYTRYDILNDIAEKVCRMNGYTLQQLTR